MPQVARVRRRRASAQVTKADQCYDPGRQRSTQ